MCVSLSGRWNYFKNIETNLHATKSRLQETVRKLDHLRNNGRLALDDNCSGSEIKSWAVKDSCFRVKQQTASTMRLSALCVSVISSCRVYSLIGKRVWMNWTQSSIGSNYKHPGTQYTSLWIYEPYFRFCMCEDKDCFALSPVNL